MISHLKGIVKAFLKESGHVATFLFEGAVFFGAVCYNENENAGLRAKGEAS